MGCSVIDFALQYLWGIGLKLYRARNIGIAPSKAFWFIVFAALFGWGSAPVVCADVTIFTGSDPGVGPGQSSPNSTQANTAFSTAASNASLGVPTTINFEGLPLGSTNQTGVPGVGLSMSNNDTTVVHWTDLSGTTHTDYYGVTDAAHSLNPISNGYNTTAGGSQFLEFAPLLNSGTASFTLNFQSPIAGMGLYLTGLGTVPGETLHALFNDGASQNFLINGSVSGGVLFWSFTDPGVDIHSVTFELDGVTGNSRDLFGADDIQFYGSNADPLSVPAPPAALLMTIGAAVTGFGRWLQARRVVRGCKKPAGSGTRDDGGSTIDLGN